MTNNKNIIIRKQNILLTDTILQYNLIRIKLKELLQLLVWNNRQKLILSSVCARTKKKM